MTEAKVRNVLVWLNEEPYEYSVRFHECRVYATLTNSPKSCDPEYTGRELCLFEFKHSDVPFAFFVVEKMLESFFQGLPVRG